MHYYHCTFSFLFYKKSVEIELFEGMQKFMISSPISKRGGGGGVGGQNQVLASVHLHKIVTNSYIFRLFSVKIEITRRVA